ncbi:MAG TPA: trypsin-like peptidase domain-containing protein [Steroidobacteraceae bacterium]
MRWLDVAPLRHPAPAVPDGFLLRPEFRYGRESSFGGYGFVVRHESAVFVLTALHVMDEVIKKKELDTTARNASYSGRELPAVVTAVQLYDVLKKQWALYELGTAGPMVCLPNSRTADEEPFAFRDIAAFQMSHAQLTKAVYSLAPRPLALRDPEPGEPVWLAAAMPDGSRTRQAVCVESAPRGLIFRYVDTKEIAKHSSGAPIVDKEGLVVGINTGLGRLEQYEFGHANPVSSIRTHLAMAGTAETAATSAGAGM